MILCEAYAVIVIGEEGFATIVVGAGCDAAEQGVAIARKGSKIDIVDGGLVGEYGGGVRHGARDGEAGDSEDVGGDGCV